MRVERTLEPLWEMGATGRRGPREGGPRSGPAGVLGSNGEGVRAETSPDAALGNGVRALRRRERARGAPARAALARAKRAAPAAAEWSRHDAQLARCLRRRSLVPFRSAVSEAFRPFHVRVALSAGSWRETATAAAGPVERDVASAVARPRQVPARCRRAGFRRAERRCSHGLPARAPCGVGRDDRRQLLTELQGG